MSNKKPVVKLAFLVNEEEHPFTPADTPVAAKPSFPFAGIDASAGGLAAYLLSILDGSPDMIISVDLNRRIVAFNLSAQRRFGYSVEEVAGQPVQILYAVPEESRNIHESVQRSGQFQGEIINRAKDGTTFVGYLVASQLRDAQGHVIGVMGISRDITDRKRAEQALRDSEIRYRTLFDTIDEGFCIIEVIFDENDMPIDLLLLETSPSFEKQTGLINAQGKRIRELAPELEEHWFQTYGRIVQTGQPARFQNWAEQFHRWYDVYAFRVGQPENRQVAVLFNDITERKHAEEKLRESEARFRRLIERAPIPMGIVDHAGVVLYFNDRFRQMFGFTHDEIPTINEWWQLAYPDHEYRQWVVQTWEAAVQSSARDGADIQPIEYKVTCKDGGVRLVQISGIILEDGILATFIDVTDERRAEAERAKVLLVLKKSREDLLAVLNQMRQAIMMTDHEGRITFVSENGERLLNRKAESVYGSRWTEVCPFEPEGKAALEAMVRRAPGQRSKIPVRMYNPQGQPFSTEVEILEDPRNPEQKIFFIYDMSEVHELRRRLDEKHSFHGLVGQSQLMQVVYRQIVALAEVDITVLIESETGTGKEKVAQAIHAAGPRARKPFVAVNSAGMTESLIGSQLFGHKRGSFTGAITDQRGVFETANGGTVFLDEIGDLPLTMQTNLLRVLQEKEVTPIGESIPRRVDVRVIAATHHSLDRLVQEGKFRQDLLYRIRVARITIPPLRERRDDIPLLVEKFLSEATERNHKLLPVVSDEAMQRMLEYDWPGNVRELQSAIESACVGCKDSIIRLEDLPPELNSPVIPASSTGNGEEDARNRLLAAIRAAKGNRAAAARLLGVSRATFYRHLQELHLDPDNIP